jgi:hypothetical protein
LAFHLKNNRLAFHYSRGLRQCGLFCLILLIVRLFYADQSPHAISLFTALDLIDARKAKMYDPQVLRALIERFWVPRDLLLKLFQEKRWPVASWLNDPPPAPIAEIISSNAATVSPENSEEEPAKSGLHGRAGALLDEPRLAKKKGRPKRSGKYLLVVEYLENRFLEESISTHEPRQALLDDVIKAIPALRGALHGDTLRKAIDEHNQKVLRQRRK